MRNPQEEEAIFAQFMAELELTDEDYFIPEKTTILNNNLKCLKKCEQLLKDMQANGETLWVDPDFGPNSDIIINTT